MPAAFSADEQDVLSLMAHKAPRLFMAISHHRTNTNKAMLFDDRPWLQDIYADNSEHLVGKKCAQVGWTEFALCDMMQAASQGISGMYVLPTDIWRNTFVTNRIDFCIRNTPLYKNNTARDRKDADSAGLKTLFGLNWKFVGSQQVNNFYEFPAGQVTIDEFDKCNQSNLPYAYDRLGASENPRTRKFGNPTLPGFGIDAEFELSDGKEWFVKCPHCNHEQQLDWFDNVVRQDDVGVYHLRDTGDGFDAQAMCSKCDRPIDRLIDGHWVAMRESDVSGYHVSKVFGDVRQSLPAIRNLYREFMLSQTNQTKLQRFYNNDLGMAFTAAGFRLTIELLSKCMGDYSDVQTGTSTVAGVDVNQGRLHTHIEQISAGGIRRKLWAGFVPGFDELQRLCHQFNVRRGVIDAMPDLHATPEWCRTHPGWYRCYYSLGENSKQMIDVDHTAKTVKVNRTASLDESFSHYVEGRVELPKNWRSLDNGDFVKQMCASTRILDEDKNRYVWDEGSQADHHQHSDNYCRIAGSMHGEMTITLA